MTHRWGWFFKIHLQTLLVCLKLHKIDICYLMDSIEALPALVASNWCVQFFRKNDIPFDPEYVFYDVKVCTWCSMHGYDWVSYITPNLAPACCLVQWVPAKLMRVFTVCAACCAGYSHFRASSSKHYGQFRYETRVLISADMLRHLQWILCVVTHSSDIVCSDTRRWILCVVTHGGGYCV